MADPYVVADLAFGRIYHTESDTDPSADLIPKEQS
jgi:hypothetical protein